jgi:hypothetical protein
MWKNIRKLRLPRRAMIVVKTQLPCPGGSLDTSKRSWRTGLLRRLLVR